MRHSSSGGSEVTTDVDYERDVAQGWRPISREHPVVVDLRVAAGRPITAETGVRVDAVDEITDDTGARVHEVEAAQRLGLAA
jgi:hypothetical protein